MAAWCFPHENLDKQYVLGCSGRKLASDEICENAFSRVVHHMDEFRQVLIFPWQVEGNLGNRTFPIVRGEQPLARAVPGLDDEAADDPAEEQLPMPVIEDLVPMTETPRRNMPLPPSAVVSAPATVVPETPASVLPSTLATALDPAAAAVAVPNIGQAGSE